MKKTSVHCQKCGSLLDSDEEMRRTLCSRCRKRLARGVRFRPKEEDRSSLMDDFLSPINLPNLGE